MHYYQTRLTVFEDKIIGPPLTSTNADQVVTNALQQTLQQPQQATGGLIPVSQSISYLLADEDDKQS